MGTTTKIEWADKTWSPWMGCSEAGPGCDHCYAKAMLDTRLHKVKWGPGQPRVHTENWDSPLRWNKQAAVRGHTIKVFPSVCDPFDNEVPPEWRRRFFNLIRDTPHLTWLLLTKRIGNAARMIAEATEREHEFPFALKPWPNVWIGATVVNQQEADRDIPKLLATPAAHRFVSIEPMLGPVDLMATDYLTIKLGRYPFNLPDEHRTKLLHRLDWVIAGGESGPHARPSHPDWFRSLRDQCAAAGVPYLLKQWGEWMPFANEQHYTTNTNGEEKHAHAWVDHDSGKHGLCWLIDDDGTWSNYTGNPLDEENELRKGVCVMGKHGKKAAGRQLDGREHLEFPPGLEPYVSPPEPAA